MTATLERPANPAARHTSPVAAMVPVDQIRFHPRNVRKNLGDLRPLTANIAAEGILQPLRLHRRGTFFEVIDGHRRLAACQQLGIGKVPAVVVAELDDDEAMTQMLGTTLREDISPAERREAIRTLIKEFEHTPRGLAERLGVHETTIRKWAADDDVVKQAQLASKAASKRRNHVSAAQVRKLADTWQERVRPDGLSAVEVRQLIVDLRALLPGDAA